MTSGNLLVGHDDDDDDDDNDDDDDDGNDDDNDDDDSGNNDLAHPGSLQFVTLCSSVKARLKVAFRCLVDFVNFSFRFLFNWIGCYL